MQALVPMKAARAGEKPIQAVAERESSWGGKGLLEVSAARSCGKWRQAEEVLQGLSGWSSDCPWRWIPPRPWDPAPVLQHSLPLLRWLRPCKERPGCGASLVSWAHC